MLLAGGITFLVTKWLVTRIPCMVIPSVAEGSLRHCDHQHVCIEGKRWLGAASHATMSVLP